MNVLSAWFVPAPDSRISAIRQQGKSPWAESVHLLWSAWVFITPVFDHSYSWRWAIVTLLTYPLFVALFAKVMLASRHTASRYALVLALFGIVLVPYYPSAVSYFIYGCVSCSLSSRRFLPFLLKLLVLNGMFLLVAWQADFAWQAMTALPCMTIIIGIVTHVERIEHEKDAALKLSHDEVRQLAATAERERIGRDLHDLLGHTLSLITLKLELSRKLFDRDTEAARREVTEAEKVARHALAEVRSAVSGIRATDLAAELASARLLLESSRVHLDYGSLPADLPGDIERGFSLILREAITNIARHAEASQARIELVRERSSVSMLISDNGRGGIGQDGNGLCGMRERVRALAGTLTIESPRGQGTRLKVTAPLPILRLVETSHAPAGMQADAALAATDSGQPAA